MLFVSAIVVPPGSREITAESKKESWKSGAPRAPLPIADRSCRSSASASSFRTTIRPAWARGTGGAEGSSRDDDAEVFLFPRAGAAGSGDSSTGSADCRPGPEGRLGAAAGRLATTSTTEASDSTLARFRPCPEARPGEAAEGLLSTAGAACSSLASLGAGVELRPRPLPRPEAWLPAELRAVELRAGSAAEGLFSTITSSSLEDSLRSVAAEAGRFMGTCGSSPSLDELRRRVAADAGRLTGTSSASLEELGLSSAGPAAGLFATAFGWLARALAAGLRLGVASLTGLGDLVLRPVERLPCRPAAGARREAGAGPL